jgi:hypothetical protein
MQNLALVLAAVAGANCVNAQMPIHTAPAGTAQRQLNGFNIYDVSGAFTYLDSGVPGTANSALLSPNGAPFESTSFGTGSVTVGWERQRPTSSAAVYYTPSYTANANYPEWNNFGQNLILRLGSPRRLSRKWRFNFAVDGNISNLQQFLFNPPLYSNVVSAPSTFEELSGAVLNGAFTNDQLASLLTGAPVMDAPARSMFFGDRILTFGGRATFSYIPRSRWSVDFDIGGNRTQHLSSPKLNTKSSVAFVTPYVNSAEITISANYSLSPKTQAGLVVSSNRSFTGYQDAYAETALVTLGHTFGRHFFAGIQAGGGLIIPVKDRYRLPTSPTMAGGITVGFKTRSSTFLLAATRSIGDSYGAGYYATLATTAAWNYMRPRSSWWIYTSCGQNWLQGTQFRTVRGWQGAGGVGRRLGSGFSIQTQYSALTYAGALGPQSDLAIQAVRVAVSWNPHGELF